MSILSRYEFTNNVFELQEVNDSLILELLNSIKNSNNPLDKVLKLLSICSISRTSNKEDCLFYFSKLIKQIFNCLNYSYTEDEVNLLTVFFVSRNTNFYGDDAKTIENIINSPGDIPNNESYDFIIESISYNLLDVYTKQMQDPGTFNKFQNLLNKLKEKQQWYIDYVNYIQDLPISSNF